MGYLSTKYTVILFLIIVFISFTRTFLITLKQLEPDESKSSYAVCGLLAIFGALGTQNVGASICFWLIAGVNLFLFSVELIVVITSHRILKKIARNIVNIQNYTENDWKLISSLSDCVTIRVDQENSIIFCSSTSEPISQNMAVIYSGFLLITAANIRFGYTQNYPDTVRSSEMFQNLSQSFNNIGGEIDFSKWQVAWDTNSIEQ